MKVKTSELSGKALDYVACKLGGEVEVPDFLEQSCSSMPACLRA